MMDKEKNFRKSIQLTFTIEAHDSWIYNPQINIFLEGCHGTARVVKKKRTVEPETEMTKRHPHWLPPGDVTPFVRQHRLV